MGRKRVKPDIDVEKMTLNPLVGTDFKVLVRKITRPHEFKLDGDDTVPVEIELECQEYTKLYKGADIRKVVSNLREPAKRLFLWIAYEIESGKDYLWINKAQYMKDVGVTSVNTYKSGLEELIRYTLICESSIRGVYWINPRFIFCGSRINKYKVNVEEYKQKRKSNENICSGS